MPMPSFHIMIELLFRIFRKESSKTLQDILNAFVIVGISELAKNDKMGSF